VEDAGDVAKTSRPDITILTPQSVPLETMRKRILDLEIFSRGLDTHAMLRKLQELVPTFKPADLHGLPPTPTPTPEQS